MRRGFVLLAVMIGLAMALAASAALLQLAQAESAGSYHSVQRAQAHALARSGMEVLAGELAAQREDILAGRLPHLDEQYVIYETGGALGVVRLLPLGTAGARLETESAKLDINEVSAEQLVATGMVDEVLAERIVQFRAKALGRPIQSLCELASVPGVTNELLIGSLERMREEHASDALADDSVRRASEERALVDVFTVYSIEADMRMDGSRRLDLSVKREVASEEGSSSAVEVGEPNAEELGEIPEVLRPLVARGTTFTKASEIVRILRENNLPPHDWPEYFETCTTQPHELRHGRIDINAAPLEALLAVPGFTVEHAEAIAAAQETLTDAERGTVCWPVIAGIVEPEALEQAIDHITNRSFCFRVRMAVGEVSHEAPDEPLRSPLVYEIVFDLASPEPRLAYLRDVTLMPAMLELAARQDEHDDPQAQREQSDALDDEVAAWDERFTERERGPDDESSDAKADSAGDFPALPDQPELPDFPPLIQLDASSDDMNEPLGPLNADDPAPNEASAAPENPVPPPARRLGRWKSR